MKISATILILASLLLVACGSKHYELRGNENANATDAEVSVDPLDGGNYMVTLEARHLLPPDRVSAGATTYVMWFKTPEGPVLKASGLSYDNDSREGEATATSSAKDFKILVTAENNYDVENPSEHVVLQQTVNM